MTTIKAEGLPDYTPKRLLCVVSADPEFHYEARRQMARDHVLHIAGRTTDPWDGIDTKSLDVPLRRHYADLIEEERKRFIETFEPRDGATWQPEYPGHVRFWSGDVNACWQGWLCARLGFLPEKQK